MSNEKQAEKLEEQGIDNVLQEPKIKEDWKIVDQKTYGKTTVVVECLQVYHDILRRERVMRGEDIISSNIVRISSVILKEVIDAKTERKILKYSRGTI